MGSQGVEPRMSRGRLVYSQLQSPVLLAARCLGADEGTRTPGLDVGDVAFCLTELHPRIDYDVRSLNSVRSVNVHRNMERKTGLEPVTSSLENSRSAC